MLGITRGLLLTMSICFVVVFLFFNSVLPITIDPIIRITYSASASLPISIGIAFFSLMHFITRDCKKQLLLICAMVTLIIIVIYTLNPVLDGDYLTSIILLSAIIGIEIVFLKSSGIQMLEDNRAALNPDVIE